MSDDDTRRLWFDAMGQAYRVPSARTSDDSPLTIYFRRCTPAFAVSWCLWHWQIAQKSR